MLHNERSNPMPARNRARLITATALLAPMAVASCNQAVPADATAAGERFADCIALPGTCLSTGPATTPDSGLAALVRDYLDASGARSAKGERATATDDLVVLGSWDALVDEIRERQAAARAASPGHPAGVARVRLVEPESGPVVDGCGSPSGTLSSGDYLGADLSPGPSQGPGSLSELSIRLDCPDGRAASSCRADLELAAAGGPDGRGTGLDLMLHQVQVRRYGPLQVYLDPERTETLFAILFDCRAGFGILGWGSLAKYDTWP